MPTTKPAVSVPVVPVVAMVNQKGGVGKTTATLNLAAALAEGQRRVLVVDCDPRNVATTTLGVDTSAVPTLTDLLLDGAGHLVSEIVLPAPLWGFDVAPADAALANRELTRTTGDEFLLADAMAGIGAHYDIVLIDTPGSLGLLTLASLRAATHAVIVTEPARAALGALAQMYPVIETIGRHSEVTLAGIVVNGYRRYREDQLRLDELRNALSDDPGMLLEPVIPERAAIAEAFGAGLPLASLGRRDGAQEAAAAYRLLAESLLGRLGEW
jgi:chromosome partitioning protein